MRCHVSNVLWKKKSKSPFPNMRYDDFHQKDDYNHFIINLKNRFLCFLMRATKTYKMNHQSWKLMKNWWNKKWFSEFLKKLEAPLTSASGRPISSARPRPPKNLIFFHSLPTLFKGFFRNIFRNPFLRLLKMAQKNVQISLVFPILPQIGGGLKISKKYSPLDKVVLRP